MRERPSTDRPRRDPSDVGTTSGGACQGGADRDAAPPADALPAAACHGGGARRLRLEPDRIRVTLVGSPNVGKSALFNRLTGAYVTVSNYPGTSVEVSSGGATIAGRGAEVVDTPGMYSLLPTTEEERVARRAVLSGEAGVLVHVIDAKNLDRMLPLTLQLAETGEPLVVALNMMDELERLGMTVDAALLAERLSVRVVPITAVSGRGLDELERAIAAAAGERRPVRPIYTNGVGTAVEAVSGRLSARYPVDPVGYATLVLQADEEALELVRRLEPDGGEAALAAAREAAARMGGPPVYRMAYERQRTAERLLEGVLGGGRDGGRTWSDRIGPWLTRPLTGVPILVVVLYFGLFKFVGQFGAGTLVDFLENTVFQAHVNPVLERAFAAVPWEWLRSLFVGEYGVLTLGVRYAVAIILPVVGSFFVFFSILEDSGYFPRLALLVDRAFKRIGLSGRAVIPMVLGFACDTMATMVTRTLETRRERVLATLLLALAVPCSAQLGVILAILSATPTALGIWAGVLVLTFLLVGVITARLLPGESATFHMELPPLRRPRLGNVAVKTYSRMQWYFIEVLPLFLFASVMLWALKLTGLFGTIIGGLAPLVRLLGLPPETARIFLFGFFRRDYGAAGLYDLHRQGALDTVQLTVAAVTLTLFVPCIAQFLMMIKERGWKTALGMFAFITPFAFGAGLVLFHLLRGLGL
ncbi:MAG TPA: ferrous iron transport protein B [Longimicrobiales bacterium]|nr:ferrous iron transport protein B [Longimicrobiales bacterium]